MTQVYSAWKHMFSEYPAILDLIHTVSIVQEIGILLVNWEEIVVRARLDLRNGLIPMHFVKQFS